MTITENSASASALTGQWRLTNFDLEFKDTGRKKPAFGPNPNGRLVLLPNAMMMVVITPSGRAIPQTAEERASAFNSMIAYSGRARIEGDQLLCTVDMAWNEVWANTVQTRTIQHHEPNLTLISAWDASPADPNKIVRGILDWVRES